MRVMKDHSRFYFWAVVCLGMLAWVVSLFCSGSGAPVTGATVNAQIAAAIKSGATTFQLPPQIDLEEPLVVPPGTHNFALVGPCKLTTSRGPLPAMIEVGIQGMGAGSLSPLQTGAIPVGNVDKGALALAAKSSLKAGAYVGLWDQNTVSSSEAPYPSVYNHFQLCKVVYSSPGSLAIDFPTARSFLSGWVTDETSQVCVNVAVRNVTFDGQTSGTWTGNFISSGFVDGLTVSGCYGQHFLNAGNLFVRCRNVLDTKNTWLTAQKPSWGGYNVYCESSTGVQVTFDTLDGGQHHFTGHGGSCEMVLSHDTGGMVGDFDLSHGMGEDNVLMEYCSCVPMGSEQPGGGGFGNANGGWKGGCTNSKVLFCDFSKCGHVSLNPGTNTITIANSQLPQIWPIPDWRDGSYAAPTNVFLTGDTVVAPFQLIRDEPYGGLWTIQNTALEATNQSWGDIFQWTEEIGGSYTLSACTIKQDTPVADVPVQLQSGACSLNLTGCTITVGGKSPYAIQRSGSFAGSVSLSTTKTNALALLK